MKRLGILGVLGALTLLPSPASAQQPPPTCSGYLARRPATPPPRGPQDGPGWEYAGVYDGLADVSTHAADLGGRALAALVPAPALVVDNRVHGALMWNVSFALDGERSGDCWRIPHHRAVAEGGPVFGVGFASRIGYRYLLQPARSAVGITLGVGTQIADLDRVRLSASPEAGVRIGSLQHPGALSLLARREIGVDRPVRDGAWWVLLGVSFY